MATVEVVSRICGYEVHEAADAFPMLEEADAKALADSIQANGQIHPIVLLDGKILDGRNRAKACELLGISPLTEEAKPGINPWDYVVAANAERRDLEPFRKAAIRLVCIERSDAFKAAQETKRLAANEARSRATEGRRGEGGRLSSAPSTEGALASSHELKKSASAKQLAAQFGVSHATVERAQELKRKDPEAFEKVCTGEIEGRKAWNEVKAKEAKEKGEVTVKPHAKPAEPAKETPKSVVDYPLMNTDTPDEIIRLTEENVLDILVEAWDRCEQSQRWRLIARVENVIAAFKEEKRS